MINKQPLCHIDNIPENDAKGFSVIQDGKMLNIFIIKRHNKIFSYENHCPHTGASLNWQPDSFMDYDKVYIQCAIHGAKFEVESGLCIRGPCVKQTLQQIDLIIETGHIYF